MANLAMLTGEVVLVFAIAVLVDMVGHYKIQLAYSSARTGSSAKDPGFLTKPALRHGVLLILAGVVTFLNRDKAVQPSSPLAILSLCLLVVWVVLLFRDSLRESKGSVKT